MSEYIYRSHGEPLADSKGELHLALAGKVVRCKECARFIPEGTYQFDNGTTNNDTCNIIRGFVVQISPEGFCAWGEIEKGEKNE